MYASAQQIFQGVEHLGETMAGGRLDPRGALRVTTSFRLARKHIVPALSLLAQRYPALDITLDVVDRRVDLISENIDLDVRVDEVQEPHLVAHRSDVSMRNGSRGPKSCHALALNVARTRSPSAAFSRIGGITEVGNSHF